VPFRWVCPATFPAPAFDSVNRAAVPVRWVAAVCTLKALSYLRSNQRRIQICRGEIPIGAAPFAPIVKAWLTRS
jgi:hypothetical protein